MSSLLQADIFFFITTIAVIVLSIVGLIIAYFIFKIVRHVEYMTKKIREESDQLSNDLSYLMDNIKEKVVHTSFGMGGILRLISNLFLHPSKSAHKTNRATDDIVTTRKAKAKTRSLEVSSESDE